jgi:hypothetical protein
VLKHLKGTRISRGNRIDFRIFEIAFLYCAEPFAINISVHDYVLYLCDTWRGDCIKGAKVETNLQN